MNTITIPFDIVTVGGAPLDIVTNNIISIKPLMASSVRVTSLPILSGRDGVDGVDGIDGVGVPIGGTTNQVLAKNSNADYDTHWVTGGGGGGAVDSVNSQTGVVVLDADDISDAATTNKFVTAAEKTKLSNTSGINTGDQDLSGLATTSALTTGLSGKANTSHTHAESDVTGLVSDLAGKEPIITAGTSSQYYRGDKTMQTLNQDAVPDGTTNKAYTATEKTKLAGVATGATANDTDANLKNRVNHTGTQSADTITDGTTNKAYTAIEKTKLAGIATGATANSADATLLDRANHTGTQTASTVSDFTEAAQDATGAMVDTTLVYTDATPQLSRAALTGAITAPSGSNATSLGSFTKAQLTAAVSDGDPLYVGDVTSNADHTGDATGSTALTLATVNSNVGSFGSATQVATFTVNGKGLTTAAGNTSIQIAESQVTNLTSDLAAKKADSMSTNKLLGRGTAGTGAIEEITLGTNLSLTGTTLNAAGGSGSPGGSTNEVQYNNGGAFAGAANVEVDTGNLKLVSTTDPAAPTGGILLYSKEIAGRHLPKIIGPAGIDTVLQTGLHGNAVFMLAPASGTTAPTVWGGTLTTAATMSVQQTIASANPWLATWRKRFATSATAGNLSGMRTAYTRWFRGNAAGFGGFWFRAQLGHNLNLNGSQCFVGLCASTAALGTAAGSVAALVNMVGMGYDTTDANTGNWFLYRNDGTGTATKVDLGATNAARSNTSHGYDLVIYCPPGAATTIYVRVVNLHNSAVVLDTSYTTDLPAVNTGMAFKAEVNNGAVASAANLEIAKVYIETDY